MPLPFLDCPLKDFNFDGTLLSNFDFAKQIILEFDHFHFRKIDIHEWHSFLTPRLKLARLFKAKPVKKVKMINFLFLSS